MAMNNIQIRFGALQFSEGTEHINKMPFKGVCLKADTPSDSTPCGSDKPVAFSKLAIENALATFSSMGVNCVYDRWDYPEYALTGHDKRFKIGVVEGATLNDNDVVINGCLWQSDFNDVCFQIKNAKDSLGFSVEVTINDMTDKGDYYLVNDFTFTGVAILYKNLAAFQDTQLEAKKKQEEEGNSFMTEQQFNDFMAKFEAIGSDITAKMVEFAEKLEKIEAKEVNVDFSEITDAIKSLKVEDATKIEAGKQEEEGKAPEQKTAGMEFVGKEEGKEISFQEKIAQIDNSDSLTPEQKVAKKYELWHTEMGKK